MWCDIAGNMHDLSGGYVADLFVQNMIRNQMTSVI